MAVYLIGERHVRIGTARRFYFLKRLAALAADEPAMAGVWRAKQEAVVPASPLSPDFPLYAVLVAAGYAALDDLLGADAAELSLLNLTSREVARILAAIPVPLDDPGV